MLQQNGPEPQGQTAPAPTGHRLFSVDRRIGPEWRPVTHVLALDPAEADRIARGAFAIDDDAELRIEAMLDGARIEQGGPVELDNCNQCSYCGGALDHFCRCYDCKRLRGGRTPVAFVPPSQRERPNTPACDEGYMGMPVIGRPETADEFLSVRRVHIVDLPAENEAVEFGDEGGSGR